MASASSNYDPTASSQTNTVTSDSSNNDPTASRITTMASPPDNNDPPPPYTPRNAPPAYISNAIVPFRSWDPRRNDRRHLVTASSPQPFWLSPVTDVSARISRVRPVAATRSDNDHSRLPFECPRRPVPAKSRGQANDAHIDIPAARTANRPRRHLQTQTPDTTAPTKRLIRWKRFGATGCVCVVISVLFAVVFLAIVGGLHSG